LHLAGFNVGNAPACFGSPAFLYSGTEMKSLGEPVHQLRDLRSGQVAGRFNNLIKRHRHDLNLPITGLKFKGQTAALPVHSARRAWTLVRNREKLWFGLMPFASTTLRRLFQAWIIFIRLIPEAIRVNELTARNLATGRYAAALLCAKYSG
jgi:hypothetical protein